MFTRSFTQSQCIPSRCFAVANSLQVKVLVRTGHSLTIFRRQLETLLYTRRASVTTKSICHRINTSTSFQTGKNETQRSTSMTQQRCDVTDTPHVAHSGPSERYTDASW